MMTPFTVWLVGAGGMALDYIKVLKKLNCHVTVIGRSKESAHRFKANSNHPVFEGGLAEFLAVNQKLPTAAIVAVGVESLASITTQLLRVGVKRILLEKPGSLTYDEIKDLQSEAQKVGAEVSIAYNRRFYSSTIAAKQIISEDGGVCSLNFEFTEWGHVIEGLSKPRKVKEAWLLGNSTHVIDLAFYLGGAPIELNAMTSGSLSWHPTSAVFAGSGRTEQGALFSYQANWDAPGRWGVEILTQKHRLILRPLETLQIIKKGSINIENYQIADEIDKEYKPGLYRQVEYFLMGMKNDFCTLEDQVKKWKLYEKIAGYK